MNSKLTPMLKQYMAIKKEYPDVILMFRLGDFYEMFGQDAEIAAKELEITLTSRDAGKAGRIPMCGVPYHSVERYIARLISKDYRVAICDQVEDPKLAKGLVKREVTRVVTPGTVIEDSMLESKSNNYLVSVAFRNGVFGLAVSDISTGEFLITELSGPNAEARTLDEVNRLSPAEILIPEEAKDFTSKIEAVCRARLTEFNLDGFMSPRDILLKQLGTTSLRGFGCEDYTAGLDAAAMVVKYLESTQPASLNHIGSLSTYSTEKYMVLDPATRRNLELTHSLSDGTRSKSLLQILDRTITAMGGRLIKKWLDQPLLDVDEIQKRLDAVGEFYGNLMMRTQVRELLQKIFDLERLASRIVTGAANARDLIALRNSLQVLPELKKALEASQNPTLNNLQINLCSHEHITDLISSSIVEEPPATLRDGNIIKPGFNQELDTLRAASKDGKAWIAGLEAKERERTGIKSLKVGYNSVFGYYIEVSKANLKFVPQNYIRKQTMVGAERFITPELKEYEAMVLGAEEKAVQLEYDLFCTIRDQIAKNSESLFKTARAIAQIDVLCSLAEVAAENRYCKPKVDYGTEIHIKNGRHPVVERMQTDELFVPNDCHLDCKENQLLIITGPNMAGKSTYLRQTALIVLMAQMGSFVPAESAHIGIVDRIFTRVGAHDELYSGQSTFMVEMTETANILNNATDRSLIILDEIGRGTSTFDGLSIAWAVAEYIISIGAKTLFATHYHHLNDLANAYSGIKNYRIAVKEEGDRIVWLRKIMPGGTDRSYGIQVARLAGLPQSVIEKAKEVLWSLENNGTTKGILDKNLKIPTRTEKLQLTLFEVEDHPVIQEIKELDISTMSPIEALTKLYEMQQRLKK
ncbi:MAG: DNA mismatch repair protein MutS [Armatimonadetes bacterium]|nr:DNA mismatch repair protein MutS [Armatimonadota bacterium]